MFNNIALQLKHELTDSWRKCRFLSIMADSVTDVGVREVEDVYVCHLVEVKTANTFMDLRECFSSKAAGIREAIGSALENIFGDWKD